MKLPLSNIPKMWIIDIDGTIFLHNAYLQGEDKLVSNFLPFYEQIPESDYILLITSREKKYKEKTLNALKKYHIRYDNIIFDAPKGERIVINDIKPKGLQTAVAINSKRDKFTKIKLVYDGR